MSAKSESEVQTNVTTGDTRHADTRGMRRTKTIAKHLRVVGGLLFLALSASLVAQTHFCIGGDLDSLSTQDIATCQAKMADVRNAVKQRGAPADWHFVVVCDEAGWKDYAGFSGHESGLLAGASYSTDPRLRWTFLRGSDLDPAQPQTTASALSVALNSVPIQRNTTAPATGTHQYVAMAHRSAPKRIAQ